MAARRGSGPVVSAAKALLAAASIAACGSDAPAPPRVECGSTADGGTLQVGAAPTCGAASAAAGTNVYTFTAQADGTHTVTLTTTGAGGDADLCVFGPLGIIDCSWETPPAWVDRVAFSASAGADYTVEVEDASAGGRSTYAVQVTAP